MIARVTKRRFAVATLVALQAVVAAEVLTTTLFGLHSAQAGQGPSRPSPPEAVPREIHMFWAGNQLPNDELANVLEWGRRTNGSGYEMTLWTTPETLEKLKETGQIEALFANKIMVRPDTRDFIDKNMQTAYDRALASGSYALASDIARYGVLQKSGGIYADVDFLPGAIDFSKPPPQMSKDDIPYFAPKVRTQKDWDDAIANYRIRNGGESPTREQIVDGLYRQGVNNNFIIAPKGSKFFNSLNANIRAQLKQHDLSKKISTNTAGGISGPATVTETINEQVRKRDESSTAGDAASLSRSNDANAQNWINMQWTTNASDSSRPRAPTPPDQPGPSTRVPGNSQVTNDERVAPVTRPPTPSERPSPSTHDPGDRHSTSDTHDDRTSRPQTPSNQPAHDEGCL